MSDFKKQLQAVSYENSNENNLLQNVLTRIKKDAEEGYTSFQYFLDEDATKYELDNIKAILQSEEYGLNVHIREEDNWSFDREMTARWRMSIDWYN